MYRQNYSYSQQVPSRSNYCYSTPTSPHIPRYTPDYSPRPQDLRRHNHHDSHAAARPPFFAYTTSNYSTPKPRATFESPAQQVYVKSERAGTTERVRYTMRFSLLKTPSRSSRRDSHVERPSRRDTKSTTSSSKHYSYVYPSTTLDNDYDNDSHTSSPRQSDHLPRTPQGTDHYHHNTSYFQTSSSSPEYHYKSTTDTRSRSRSTSLSRTPPRRRRYTHVPAVATAADALHAGIPAGYSLKNWDPTETPLLLLGSVFDANSLGRWIYDWTVYTASSSLCATRTASAVRRARAVTDAAGDLWLLLIALAGRLRRGASALPLLRRRTEHHLLADYLASGRRLWHRLEVMLGACEAHMWRIARQEAKAASPGRDRARPVDEVRSMGASSGVAFVECMFGRGPNGRRDDTARLMQGLETWGRRFDANCAEIVRLPDG